MKGYQLLSLVMILLLAPAAFAEGVDEDVLLEDTLDLFEEVEGLQEEYEWKVDYLDCDMPEAEQWYDYSSEYLDKAEESLDAENFEQAYEHAKHAMTKIETAFDHLVCDESDDEKIDYDEAYPEEFEDDKEDVLERLTEFDLSSEDILLLIEDVEKEEDCSLDDAREHYKYAQHKSDIAEQHYEKGEFSDAIEFLEYGEDALDLALDAALCEPATDVIDLALRGEVKELLDEVEEKIFNAKDCDVHEAKELYAQALKHFESDGEWDLDKAMELSYEAMGSVFCEDEEDYDEFYDLEELEEPIAVDIAKSNEGDTASDAASCESGCVLDDRCLPVGYRDTVDELTMYCSGDGALESQREDGDACQNDFECISNSCSSGSCYDVKKEIEENRSLLTKILDFFSWLF